MRKRRNEYMKLNKNILILGIILILFLIFFHFIKFHDFGNKYIICESHKFEIMWKFTSIRSPAELKVYGDMVYFTESNYALDDYEKAEDYVEYLNAINAENGKFKWKFKSNGTRIKGLNFSNNTVYFGEAQGPLGLASYEYHICALNAKTGKLLWKTKLDGEVISDVVLYDHMIFFAVQGYEDHSIYGLDSATGEKRWQYKYDEYKNKPLDILKILNGIIYYKNINSNMLYALEIESCKVKWKFEVDEFDNITDFLIDKDKLYISITNYKEENSILFVLDSKTGSKEKSLKINNFYAPLLTLYDQEIVLTTSNEHSIMNSNSIIFVDLRNMKIIKSIDFTNTVVYDPPIIRDQYLYIVFEPAGEDVRDESKYNRRYLIAVDLKTNKEICKIDKIRFNPSFYSDLIIYSSEKYIIALRINNKM